MSALARFFKQRGDSVCGYDHTASPLTRQLEAEGIEVHYDDNPEKIPSDIDLCIYTPAVPKETSEYQYIASKSIPICKRSQVLGELTRGKKCIAVAGSHGKTTTSGLIAHLLRSANIPTSAFLGGISKNIGSNMCYNPHSEYVVVEADEYDRSFLQLYPHYSVITSTDPDHLDIYGSHANLLQAFLQYAKQTDATGHLFINKNSSLLKHCMEGKTSLTNCLTCQTSQYGGIHSQAEYRAERLHIDNGTISFDYIAPNGNSLQNLKLYRSAPYNVENAVAAIAVAQQCGASEKQIKEGLATFTGIQRRFDYRVSNANIIYIDDYAHHPAEIAASIQSARTLFPNKRIVGIFQPHLYSRTADFADDFAKVLSTLDGIVMMDIYPAREHPLPGVTSQMVLDKIANINKRLCTKEEIPSIISELQADVLMTLGAGDIDRIVPEIEKHLTQNTTTHK